MNINEANYIQELIFDDTFPDVAHLNALQRPSKPSSRARQLPSSRPTLPANLPDFRVIRSTRRKRGVTALRQNGIIEIHIPDRMTRRV
mgnify:CR=1 FL=1